MGLASRQLGLTCDTVSGLRIVTADGRIRHVDERTDPDLFWACRGGGGGNFGIVTSLSCARESTREADAARAHRRCVARCRAVQPQAGGSMTAGAPKR